MLRCTHAHLWRDCTFLPDKLLGSTTAEPSCSCHPLMLNQQSTPSNSDTPCFTLLFCMSIPCNKVYSAAAWWLSCLLCFLLCYLHTAAPALDACKRW